MPAMSGIDHEYGDWCHTPDIAANPNVVEQVAPNANVLKAEIEILLNHIFILQGGPWSCDDLRHMDGQIVEAVNGKNRVIVYNVTMERVFGGYA